MGFVANGPRIWPIAPDWGDRVTESLAWGTDVMLASASAMSWHLGYRIGPRRSVQFGVAAFRAADRQLADNLLAGYRGRWRMPLWQDVQWRTGVLSSGATSVPCVTEGFEFVAGGEALLYTDARTWEVVSIDTVASDHLGLAGATVGIYGPGARLYPLRWALPRIGSEERLLTDQASRRQIAFDIDEPTDWPALDTPTLYLAHPVLDMRPDESDDPSVSYDRLLQGADYDGARPFVYDLADQALRLQSTGWKLFGRPSHTWFRSLLATLNGRNVPMWLPSYAADLTPAAAIAGGSTSLSVAWCGYTQFCKNRHNRRDLRIELFDGTVYYRRVTNAVEAGATETLTLSASLDAGSIGPERIRQISYMALSTLASDSVEIEHVTDADGTATSTLGWKAVVPDA